MLKIINETDLSYSTIGLIIDNIIESNNGNTMYYGKVEWTVVEFGGHKIKVQIRYLKRYVEWRFWEIANHNNTIHNM